MTHPYVSESSEVIWFEKWRCDDAEKMFHEKLAGSSTEKSSTQNKGTPCSSSLICEIAKARQHIQNSLKTDNIPVCTDSTVMNRLQSLEKENCDLYRITDELLHRMKSMENRIIALENKGAAADKPIAKTEEEDEDFELFGSDDDEDDIAAEKLKEERIKQYNEKKGKKAAVIAKSNIILDVKPWDDETDMGELEKLVRGIQMDGLLWGASKLVPLAYGIKKLQICCVVEDDKVGTDDLEEKICAFEEYVQSMDIAAFNKI